MKIWVTLLLSFVSVVSYAQNGFLTLFSESKYVPLDLERVEAAIVVPSSPYFYPSLVERYNKNDTTLTLDDYRYLYYGYAFSSNYEPYKSSMYADSVANVILADRRIITAASSPKLIYYIGKILEKEPFNIEFLNMMSYVYGKMGDETSARVYSDKLNRVVQAIFSSGTGVAKESPWYILYRSDVMSVMSILGVEVARRAYITKSVEYYRLAEKLGDIKAFYFDFSLILRVPDEVNQKRRFEFNPYYNPKSDKFINTKI